MLVIETHIVKTISNPLRFQEYGVGIFKTIITKSALKKAIKKNRILINGFPATTGKIINGNEKIELLYIEKETTNNRLKLNLEVLYEDQYLAIIYKPAGILVSGNKFVTITNALSQNLIKSTFLDTVKPQPIHRLDYATSGVLLIGKTANALMELGKLFENKKVQKKYFAVTIGKMKKEGIINSKIDNKEAITQYLVIKSVNSARFGILNLVLVTPKTGRKHQIRKHLFTINHPILGDKKYFLEGLLHTGKGMYLHAENISFTHPLTQKTISISKKLPPKFDKIFNKT